MRKTRLISVQFDFPYITTGRYRYSQIPRAASRRAALWAHVPQIRARISFRNIQIYWHLRARCRSTLGISLGSIVTRLVRSLRVTSCMIARSASDFGRARPLVSRDMQHKSCFRFQFITPTECPRTKGTMIYTSVPYSHRKFIA